MANPLVSMGAPLANPVNAANMNMDAIKEAMESAKRTIAMINSAKDPRKILSMVAQQNPGLNAALQMLNGRSFQEACIEEYKRYGIDPNPIIQELRS